MYNLTDDLRCRPAAARRDWDWLLATLLATSLLRSMLYGTGARHPVVIVSGMPYCGSSRVYYGIARCLNRAHGSVTDGMALRASRRQS
jgi:hypothetical protein